MFFSLKICHKASNGASNKAQVIQIILDEILCPFVSQLRYYVNGVIKMDNEHCSSCTTE